MEENARIKREAEEAKAQAGEDKQEAEQDSTKMAAEGLDSLLEGDVLQFKEAKEDLSSQGNLELHPVTSVFEKICIAF